MKWLQSLGQNQRLFHRGTWGITGINNINDLPLSLQFAAGGSESVRGYQYQQLIYGHYLTVLSAELQQRLVGNWYVLGFVDAGTVSNKIFGPGCAAGPGIMWLFSCRGVKDNASKAFLMR